MLRSRLFLEEGWEYNLTLASAKAQLKGSFFMGINAHASTAGAKAHS